MADYRYESVPLIALAFGLFGTLFAIGIGSLLIGRWTRGLPPTAVWGLCGAVGLGAIGMVTFFAGIAGLFVHSWFFYGGAAIWAVVGAVGLRANKDQFAVSRETDAVSRILILVIGLLVLTRLPAVFTPSAGADWDTTSHQLAMSKVWLLEGKVSYLSWMNHSNIPGTVNMVYVWGLEFGGQAGAKMIAWWLAILAVFGVGGLTAHKYGRIAGNWAALAFICVPVILWEPGTAYQDVIHGFYGGAAAVLSAIYIGGGDKRMLFLSGIMLGLSIATKYTGFQVAFALVVAILLIGAFARETRKSVSAALVVGLIALAVASPWYLRNIATTGNPVYPFFYSVFGGKDWTPDMAHAYSTEQKRFGVWTFSGDEYTEANKGVDGASRNPLTIPGAITALAIQPHRQINGGAYWGTMGPLLLLSVLFWCFSGRLRREEALCVLVISIALLSWFYLTQQSRYIIALMVPGAFLLGGVISRLAFRRLAIAAISIQSAVTLFWFAGLFTLIERGATSEFGNSMKFLSSGKPDSAYLSGGDFGGGPMRRFPFWEATAYINRLAAENSEMRVALLDEVRGFYLDARYFWASPGFSTLIPWSEADSPQRFVDALRELGATHIYMNFDPSVIGSREEARQLQYVFAPSLFAQQPDLADVADFRGIVAAAYRAGLLIQLAAFDEESPGGPPRAVLLEVR